MSFSEREVFRALKNWLRDDLPPDLSGEVLDAVARRLAHGEPHPTVLRRALERLLHAGTVTRWELAALLRWLKSDLPAGPSARLLSLAQEEIERGEPALTPLRSAMARLVGVDLCPQYGYKLEAIGGTMGGAIYCTHCDYREVFVP